MYVCVGSGLLRGQDWESLFDVVIVGACKPAFLTDEFMSIFRVDRFELQILYVYVLYVCKKTFLRSRP